MNKVISIFFNLALITLTACNNTEEATSSNTNTKVQLLEKRIYEDSLLLTSVQNEMDAVNNTLDSATALNDNFKTGKNIKRQEALDKIRTINTLLAASSEKINLLEQDLANTKSELAKNSIVKTAISGKAAQVKTTQKYYLQLEKDVQQLRNENVSLKSIIAQKENELLEKDNVLAKIKAERQEQEKKLADIMAKMADAENRIAQSEKDLKNAKEETKRQKATIYYETGKELFGMFKEMDKKLIEIGTGKAKKALLKQAYECFKQSASLGRPEAQREIIIIESDYKKYLEK
jgi:chromosome segregation ATPase